MELVIPLDTSTMSFPLSKEEDRLVEMPSITVEISWIILTSKLPESYVDDELEDSKSSDIFVTTFVMIDPELLYNDDDSSVTRQRPSLTRCSQY